MHHNFMQKASTSITYFFFGIVVEETICTLSRLVIANQGSSSTSEKNLICCGFLAIICCGFGPKQYSSKWPILNAAV